MTPHGWDGEPKARTGQRRKAFEATTGAPV